MKADQMEKKWYSRHPKDGKILPIDDPAGKGVDGGYIHSYVLGDPKDGRILGNIHKLIPKEGTYIGCGWMAPTGEFSTYEKAKEYVEAQTAEPENWEDINRVVEANWDIGVSKFSGRWMDDIMSPPGDANPTERA